MELKDQFKSDEKITWCPGCGDFAILEALKEALVKLGLKPHDVLVVYGIGCHGHMVNYLKTYGFEGLHGRALPLATGAKLANKNLVVIAIVGDGDQLGEGGNHLIHTAKRNPDITCIVHDNQVYALTVNQATPTSLKGFKTRSSPEGVREEPLNPVALAISVNCSFVARGFAGRIKHLTSLFVEAIKHKGFSFIDVLQPCVTFNYLNTYSWYYQRVYEMEPEYDLEDRVLAFKKSLEFGDKIPLGIFYKKERPTLEDNLLKPEWKPLLEQDIKNIDISQLIKEFS